MNGSFSLHAHWRLAAAGLCALAAGPTAACVDADDGLTTVRRALYADTVTLDTGTVDTTPADTWVPDSATTDIQPPPDGTCIDAGPDAVVAYMEGAGGCGGDCTIPPDQGPSFLQVKPAASFAIPKSDRFCNWLPRPGGEGGHIGVQVKANAVGTGKTDENCVAKYPLGGSIEATFQLCGKSFTIDKQDAQQGAGQQEDGQTQPAGQEGGDAGGGADDGKEPIPFKGSAEDIFCKDCDKDSGKWVCGDRYCLRGDASGSVPLSNTWTASKTFAPALIPGIDIVCDLDVEAKVSVDVKKDFDKRGAGDCKGPECRTCNRTTYELGPDLSVGGSCEAKVLIIAATGSAKGGLKAKARMMTKGAGGDAKCPEGTCIDGFLTGTLSSNIDAEIGAGVGGVFGPKRKATIIEVVCTTTWSTAHDCDKEPDDEKKSPWKLKLPKLPSLALDCKFKFPLGAEVVKKLKKL